MLILQNIKSFYSQFNSKCNDTEKKTALHRTLTKRHLNAKHSVENRLPIVEPSTLLQMQYITNL